MKKQIIIAVAVLALCAGTKTAQASWFDNGEKERRIQVEQQLQFQQKAANQWQGIAFVLGIGTIATVTLILGSVIGSRARRAARKEDGHEHTN